MNCRVCNEDYKGAFVDDFQDGICFPCQVEASMKQWELDVDAELSTLNALLQTGYDFDGFCYDCWQCPEKIVQGLSQSKTPILFEVYESELSNKHKYYFGFYEPGQMKMF